MNERYYYYYLYRLWGRKKKWGKKGERKVKKIHKAIKDVGRQRRVIAYASASTVYKMLFSFYIICAIVFYASRSIYN